MKWKYADYNLSFIKFIFNKKKKIAKMFIIALPSIYVISNYEDIFYNYFSYDKQRSIVLNNLNFTFSFNNKFREYNVNDKNMAVSLSNDYEQLNNNSNYIGEFFPTNIFDIEKILNICRTYNIKVVSDYNNLCLLNFPHIKINFSEYSLFEINKNKKYVKLSQGLLITDIITRLYKQGYYLEGTENIFENKILNLKSLEYMFNSIKLSDILHKNFYSYNDFKGSTIFNNLIKELTVITANSKVMILKQSSNFHYQGFNLLNMFLNCYELLGLTPEIKINIKEISCIESNSSQQSSNINNTILLNTNIESSIFTDYLKNTSNINFNENLFNLVNVNMIDKSHNEFNNDKLYRRIKIKINSEEEYSYLIDKFKKRIKFISKSSQCKEEVKYFLLWNNDKCMLYLNILFLENFAYIEDCINLIDYLINLTNKLETFALIDDPILGSSKYQYNTQRCLGYNQFYINEDLKDMFDSQYILNPHYSLKKPSGTKLLKRNNKVLNYLFKKFNII